MPHVQDSSVKSITEKRFDKLLKEFQENASLDELIQVSSQEVFQAYPKNLKCYILEDYFSIGEFSNNFREFKDSICEIYNLEVTVAAYYPPGGFIGWHTNENIPWHNAICTYSSTGSSFFEYKVKDNIIRIDDLQGWSVKYLKWGKETPVWHRAVANDQRITITFSSPDKQNIDKFITDITR